MSPASRKEDKLARGERPQAKTCSNRCQHRPGCHLDSSLWPPFYPTPISASIFTKQTFASGDTPISDGATPSPTMIDLLFDSIRSPRRDYRQVDPGPGAEPERGPGPGESAAFADESVKSSPVIDGGARGGGRGIGGGVVAPREGLLRLDERRDRGEAHRRKREADYISSSRPGNHKASIPPF
ncbi:hypothetical protein SKAU_G00368220 [Synaphobranchus kaupii]|uniref:Uncharacterized protein n=1 Tax=Synaphobranchus kaupii TaxID=118154 RepID=A0A9Q1EFI4_SYNKA|nr:hypothetical protein SKAU_G00368220 [Synaphobranchus kaupii]